ncbi:hypothetical protein [Leptolyngbya sp. Heron Island J]|uniref:hypothetical protein n=1 Tax=Leptolyngbya sp. Heron Island J TaxID=1385935 RepID=UPI0013786240|nr:hypothetical protein [Leptolyngbya sp. Heron Island J]
MKVIVDGLTCIMMALVIMLCSKILFPEKTDTLLNDVNLRWDAANEIVESESPSKATEYEGF